MTQLSLGEGAESPVPKEPAPNTTPAPARAATARRRGGAAFVVAAGILISRLLGFARERVQSRYLGLGWQADAFAGAFSIPNFLQNLFGEGVLSASFIPVYAKLVAEGDDDEAGRVAGAVLALLALVVAVIVLLGVLAAPLMVDLITSGFEGTKRELTVRLVRVLFPGAGLLVLSAWCLGILNSHRRFFLSYVAPVIWNVAMIATMIGFGSRVSMDRLVVLLAWGSVVGSALQFLVQLPTVLGLVKRLRVRLDTQAPSVRQVARQFGPVFVGRGVVQISGYVDRGIASHLVNGALAALNKAQMLYFLPISLFGMAVSAAELPAMSSEIGTTAEVAATLQRRLNAGMRRIAFFVVPSGVVFITLGDVLIAALMQNGAFGPRDTRYVWGILAGSSVGLLASALGRLDASTFYAMRDTRTPLRTAILRIVLTTALGLFFAFPVPRWLGIDPRWGAAGLTASAGIAGWVEFVILRGILNGRIGRTGLPAPFAARLYASALVGAAAGWGVKLTLPAMHPALAAVFILGTFGVVYLALVTLLGVPEATEVTGRLRRLAGRR